MNRFHIKDRLQWMMAAFLAVTLVGCGLLDVDNPNNVLESDLNNAVAAAAIANGAEVLVATAYGQAYAPNATASDECTWIGSRDAWNEIDRGNGESPLNEFTDAVFPTLGRARWTADNAITLLEGFNSEGSLGNTDDLARTYKHAALIYMLIADMWDDFALSNKTEAAPAIGEGNMDQLYDTAIGYLNTGIGMASAGLANEMTAIRARAKHGKAVWGLLNPAGSTPGNPWTGAGADDAAAYVAAAGAADNSVFAMMYSSASATNNIAFQVNERLELAVAPTYAVYPAGAKLIPGNYQGTALNDPMTALPDPRVDASIRAFFGGGQYSNMPYTSTVEMHLILAEADAAGGNMGAAEAHINDVRALTGQPAYDSATSGVSVTEMLAYERQANLFFFGRRLNDMYRFGVQSPEWDGNSKAATTPGTFFPITIIEIRSNPLIGG